MATSMKKSPNGENKSAASEKSGVAQNKIDKTVENNLVKENEDLKEKFKNLEEMFLKLSDSKNNTPQSMNVYASRMDKPCTLVHMAECSRDLPNSIMVNGNIYNFSMFGEKRLFRFQDMQQIVSKYRGLFERCIFMLGEDCQDEYEGFGIEVIHYPLSVDQHKRLAELPIEEFESIVKALNGSQRALIANTWVARYNDKIRGYDNLEKIRILNKATDGLLKSLIEQVSSVE